MTQQDRDIELLKKVARQIPSVGMALEAQALKQSEAIYNAPDQNRELGPHLFVDVNHCPACARAEKPVSEVPEKEARAAAERLKAAKDYEASTMWPKFQGKIIELPGDYDAVDPPHYQRGPVVNGHIGEGVTKGIGSYSHTVQCIEVAEAIEDFRLATALKYIWRVGFGGKKEPWDSRSQEQVDKRDIESAIWYLKRYVAQIDSDSPAVNPCYDQAQPDSEGH